MPYELNQTIPQITIDTKYSCRTLTISWTFGDASEYRHTISTLRHLLINKVPFGVGFLPEKIEKVRALTQKERFA